MFWRFGFQTQSAIDQLLDKEELSLQDLLDEDELIQELKSNNKKLLDFVCRSDVLEALLSYIIDDPDTDLGEKNKFRYPSLASEIFCCEVMSVCEALIQNEPLLVNFWKFLENPAPLNPIQCSYFAKLYIALLQKKPAETIAFFKSLENPIDVLIRHIGTSPIMDLLLKFVSLEELKEGEGVFQWLSQEKLVYKLVLQFNPKNPQEFHSNASQTIVDLMAISQGIKPQNELIDQLKSAETISKIIEFMSEKDSPNYESSLGSILTVLIEFIQRSLGFFEVPYQTENGAFETETREEDIDEILKQIEPKLEFLHQVMLQSKPQGVTVEIDKVDPKDRIPLGSLRLKLVEFFVVLLHANNKEINQRIIDLKILPCYIDLFFRYEYNNFLHSLIHDMLVRTLSTDLELWEELCYAALKEGRLLDRVARAAKENDQEASEEKGFRKPYMGHLTLISNHLIKFIEEKKLPDVIKETFDTPLWKEYESSSLQDTNTKNNKPLGGHRPLNQLDNDQDSLSHDPFQMSGINQNQFIDDDDDDDDFDNDLAGDDTLNVNFDQGQRVFDDSSSDEEETLEEERQETLRL